MNKRQKGFSSIEGLLVVIILVLIGFVGWYVRQATSNSDKNLNDAANTNIVTSTNKSTSSSAQSEQFKMPEVKLKLSIPKSLSNLQYNAVQNDAGIYTIEFSDTRLQKPNCDNNAPSSSFEIAFAEASQSSDGPLQGAVKSKKVGDKYWNLDVYTKPSCSNGSDADSIYQTDSQLLESSWQSLSTL